MQRRSSNRTPRKKYTVDAFETVPELRDISRSTSPGEASHQSADQAFDAAGDAEPSEDDISDVDVDAEAEAAELSDAHSAEVSDEDDVIVRKSRPAKSKPQARAKQGKIKDEKQVLQSRRLQDNIFRSSGKEVRLERLYGSGPEDAAFAIAAANRWTSLPVLPTHIENPSGKGGFVFHQADPQTSHHLYHTDWLWYFEQGGQQSIVERQSARYIDSSAAQRYLPVPPEPLDFLFGPVRSPHHHQLPAFQAMSLASAWKTKDGTKPRQGFILNAGARVHDLRWVPRHGQRSEQFLAVSVSPDRLADHAPFESPVAPAFTPAPAYDTAIQIWHIPTSAPDLEARLAATVCTSWGDLKCFQFCPMPCDVAEEPPTLLAGIWGDGTLRLIELPSNCLSGESTAYCFDKAALKLRPPDTVFTCLTWISPRLIAAGTASGCIATIDIHEVLRTNKERPSKYAVTSDAYIHDIASCWPSFPQLLFTLSMDGHVRLTDSSTASMSIPEANAQAPRVRAVLSGLTWSDFAQCAFITDDNFTLRAHPVRRMFSHFSAGRTKSTAIAIAQSPYHPFILLGTTGGDVVATNPLIRVNDPKKIMHMQTWFSHEWRRPAAGDEARSDGGRIANNGISRFVDGYKAEIVKFNDGDGSTRNYVPQTVYEKKTAVTAVAWNPNVVAAGWAAAGLADGLIRVEDIALP